MIFADVVGSTALGERVDAETLRWAMQRWFDSMSNAIARHGGTVENLIGDAVMGVFGIPLAHEDDALRAVRAAVEMRDKVEALRGELRRERGVDFSVRIGINTGEAVTGARASGGFFTAGDIVNVAARLEQSATPGDILLGRETFSLVRHAVYAESIAPLSVKGKRAAVEAYQLVAVVPGAGARAQRPRAPMVGRQRERRRVIDAFHQAVADRSCQLFTVLGAAGVGKSRLVAELTQTIEDVATVAVGRCLPYGDGLTWWPLAEAIGESGLLENASAGDERAATRAAELFVPGDQAVSPDEAFWAVRKVLEAIARARPLVLVIDDLQWAEPTFIDLLEHVGDYTRDAPLLLLIMARLELLDVRPGWGGGKLNATTVLLEPLPERDAADLLLRLTGPQRLSDAAAARILALAEGNPLFVEEVVAMLIDDGVLPPDAGESEWPLVTDLEAIAVPPTIHALLAARLDRLPPPERAVIEAASIEGKQFARDRLEALLVESLETGIDSHLAALVRKDLIRPIDTNEDNFRFRHQLIRDAAYDAMPKNMRADLHERFANELQASSTAIPVVEELLGYHLERAVVLRRELGAPELSLTGLAKRASANLRAAGRRAALRDDPSSVRLLERALALATPAERPAVLAELANAVEDAGDLPRADEIAASAIKGAREVGDRQTIARAQLVALRVRSDRELRASDLASFDSAGRLLLAEFESLDDDQGAAATLQFLGAINMNHFERSSALLERALLAADRCRDRKIAAHVAGAIGIITVFGPVPAAAGIERCHALRRQFADHPGASAVLRQHEAVLQAMQGHIQEARTLDAEADRIIDDLGSRWLSASKVFGKWAIELFAGAPETAEAAARASLELLTEMGATNPGSTAAALLAVALAQQDRHEEALRYADLAASWAAPDDMASQVAQLRARARVLTARGDLVAAEALAREAIRLAERSDDIWQQGDALVELGGVLDAAGRTAEAAAAIQDGIVLYVRKGNVVSADCARTMVERLGNRADVADRM